ncbi:MAG: hypothetical protein ACREDM_05780, partial [Methylocella sp.]
VAQTPNLALSVFLVSTAILWLGHPDGAISTGAKVAATGSLIVWALDEVVRGVNPWRRFLGVAVLIYEVYPFARELLNSKLAGSSFGFP